MRNVWLVIVTVMFVGCSKENGTNKSVHERIVGEWNGVESELLVYVASGNQTFYQDLSYLTIEFLNDGTFVSDSLGIPLESGLWSTPDVSTFVLDSFTFNIDVLTDTHFYFQIDSVIDQGGASLNVSQTTKLAK